MFTGIGRQARPAVVRSVKHIHNTKKFVISRKLFENDRTEFRNNKNKELDSTDASKLSVVHELLDVNNDGVVSIDDLKELTKRFSENNNMTEEQTVMFSRVIENLWQKHWGCIDPFDYVTIEKYLRYIQYVKKNKSLQREVVQLLPYLFKAADKDNSGDLTQEEYDSFVKCIGTSNKNGIIKSLGIINDSESTLKLDNLMSVIKKYLFHNRNESNKTQ